MNEQDLATFAKVVPILLTCGAVLKHALPKFPHRAIPLLTLPVGIAAFCQLSRSWSMESAFDGFAAFLLSTGAHSGLKNLFFGSASGESGAGEVAIKSKSPDARLLVLVLGPLLAFAPVGCKSSPKSPQAVAFLSLADTWAGVKAGMVLYTDAYARGEIDESDREKIDRAYVNFRLSFLSALELAQFDWSDATPDRVAALSAQLLALIDQLNL